MANEEHLKVRRQNIYRSPSFVAVAVNQHQIIVRICGFSVCFSVTYRVGYKCQAKYDLAKTWGVL